MKFYCHHPQIDQEVDRAECGDCCYFQSCKYLPKTNKKGPSVSVCSIDLEEESCRLWVEYLRHSYRYKKLCEKLSEYGIDKGEDLNDAKVQEIAPELKEFFNEDKISRVIQVFMLFGNIFRKGYSFDEWWKWACAQIEDDQKDGRAKEHEKHQLLEGKPLVEPLGESIETEIYMMLGMVEADLGREPTLDEFIKYVVGIMKAGGSGYLRVELGGNIASLMEEFKELVARSEERVSAKKLFKLIRKAEKMRSFIGLHPPIDEEELQNLKKYLLVYCKKEEEAMSWEKIIADSTISDNWRDPNKRNDRRLFQLYRQKGKKIIENAENGIFPWEFPTTTEEEVYKKFSRMMKNNAK